MKRNDKGEGDHTLYLQPLRVCRYSMRGVGVGGGTEVWREEERWMVRWGDDWMDRWKWRGEERECFSGST